MSDVEICSEVREITLLNLSNTMPCGCKNKQQPQAAPKTESIVKRTRPTNNGVRGMRTEKRIIR